MQTGELLKRYRELGFQKNLFREENLKKGKIYIHPNLMNYVSTLEMFSVLKRIKPAAAQVLVLKKNSDIKKIIKGMEEMKRVYGLHFTVSNNKYLVDSNRDFSSIGPAKKEEGHFILSYSFSKDSARKGVEYFLKKGDISSYSRKFGELMGYPKCCLDFGDSLTGNTKDAKKIKEGFVWSQSHKRSFRNSTKISPLLNIFSTSIIPFIPCHLDCKEAKKYALKLLKLLRKESPRYAKALEFFLVEPNVLFWNYTERIIFLGDKKENTLNYYDFQSKSYSEIKFYQAYLEPKKRLEHALSLIERGDKIVMHLDRIEVFKGEKLMGTVPKDTPFECILF